MPEARPMMHIYCLPETALQQSRKQPCSVTRVGAPMLSKPLNNIFDSIYDGCFNTHIYATYLHTTCRCLGANHGAVGAPLEL